MKVVRFLAWPPDHSHCALFTLRPMAVLRAPHLDREIFTLFPTFPVPEFQQGRISHFTLAMALFLPLSCFLDPTGSLAFTLLVSNQLSNCNWILKYLNTWILKYLNTWILVYFHVGSFENFKILICNTRVFSCFKTYFRIVSLWVAGPSAGVGGRRGWGGARTRGTRGRRAAAAGTGSPTCHVSSWSLLVQLPSKLSPHLKV